jgi:hypothetical protein
MPCRALGSARVAGFDVVREAQEVRRRIGVTFQELVLLRMDPSASPATPTAITSRCSMCGQREHTTWR